MGKPDSKKSHSIPAYMTGLSRREFIRQTGVATLLASLAVYKPVIARKLDTERAARNIAFSEHQQAVLQAAQMQLFPADGDGPSARDINALAYLEWALTDPGNIEDGDREFIIKGIDWLEEHSRSAVGKSFIKTSPAVQHQLLDQFSDTDRGENWMSLLIYYLIEALLLDPVYGGNTNGIGWKWLEHQPGFPRPGKKQTYRRYLS